MSIVALTKLVSKQPITQDMIAYVACKCYQVITCSNRTFSPLPPLDSFIGQLAKRSRISTTTFLTTLVLLDRLKNKLPLTARGMGCTRHRVFLAALVITCKLLHDAPPKNRHWARCSGLFSVAEVNLMEKQLLLLLDYDLRIREQDLLEHFSLMLHPTIPMGCDLYSAALTLSPSERTHHHPYGQDARLKGCV
ncbi:uncharacterized protein VTP21DRAFT_4317 [Calcarisporiella thermophila]|uniref:uncharacterized protein n=1 Tax=Calcarisporiella thermophila TaxID=911321 RepID=UPI003742C5FD